MVQIAHASKNEKGTYKDGKKGDQTRHEVYIRSWYSRPWTHVIRAKSQSVREKIAYAMESAADNDNIGYSQLTRNSALLESCKYGYDPSKIRVPVNTDCSALVTLSVIYAGIPQTAVYVNSNSSTTSNLRSRLMKTGMFEVFSDKSYTEKTNKLERGDILLSEGKHVAVVVQTDSKEEKKSVHEIALEVIDGKWSNGAVRVMKLSQAGYNATEVQQEINRILRG